VKKFLYLHFGFVEPTPEIMAAWMAWFESISDKMVDQGGQFSGGREISKSGIRDLPLNMESITGYTVIEAERFGIRGTVKNLDNGDVEVYAQGEEAAVERFEAFLRRGPYMARVDEVIREEVGDARAFPYFDVEF